jgi:hypothetical protein
MLDNKNSLPFDRQDHRWNGPVYYNYNGKQVSLQDETNLHPKATDSPYK